MSSFRFQEFELDLRRMELRHRGTARSLPRLPMNLLVLLLERNGDLVTRQEIAEKLWPGTNPADIFQSINNAITRIRYTLGDTNPEDRMVETVIGRGYRFAVPIERVERWPETADGTATETRAVALEAAAAEEAPGPVAGMASPAAKRRDGRIRWVWPTAVLIAAVCVATVWTAFSSDRRASTLVFTRIAAKSSGNPISTAAVSPEGTLIAFADEEGPKLQSLRDASRHPLRAPVDFATSRLAWMADGLHLVQSGVDQASSRAQIWMISTTGDPPVLLRDRAAMGVPSPDGTRLAFVADDLHAIGVMNLSGGGVRLVQAGGPNVIFPTVLWSADGRMLLVEKQESVASEAARTAFSRNAAVAFNPSYIAVDAASGRVTASVADVWMDDACLDGRDLIFVEPPRRADSVNATAGSAETTTLRRVRLNSRTGGFASAPVGIGTFPARITGLSYSPRSDTFVAVEQEASPQVFAASIHWPGPTLGSIRPLTSDRAHAYPHGWSPDSATVLLESDQTGRYQIYGQRVDSLDAEAISPGPGAQTAPRMTSDGQWVLFAGDGQRTLLRTRAGGSAPEKVSALYGGLGFRCAAHAPTCMLWTESDATAGIALVDPIKGKGAAVFAVPRAWGSVTDWDLSADGLQIVLLATPVSGPARLHVVSWKARTNSVVPLPGDLHYTAVNWFPGREAWVVAASTARGGSLSYVDATGRMSALHQTRINTFGVPSPDGKMLAFVDLEAAGSVWLLKQR